MKSKTYWQIAVVASCLAALYFLYVLLRGQDARQLFEQDMAAQSETELYQLQAIRVGQQRDSVAEENRMLQSQLSIIKAFAKQQDSVDKVRIDSMITVLGGITRMAANNAVRRQKMEVQMILPDSSKVIAKVRDTTVVEVDKLRMPKPVPVKSIYWTDGTLIIQALLKGDSLYNVRPILNLRLRRQINYFSRGALKRPDLVITQQSTVPYVMLDTASRYLEIKPYATFLESLLKPKK